MADSARHLNALRSAAGDCRRTLESNIAAVDAAWNDGTRRAFEAQHLAAIRSDARHLGVDLAAIVATAERALSVLGND